jgi:hypothetical protein
MHDPAYPPPRPPVDIPQRILKDLRKKGTILSKNVFQETVSEKKRTNDQRKAGDPAVQHD